MKAQSAGLRLYEIDAGHHGQTCRWHDADHKAEVLGSLPGIFISQRWVTQPQWMDLRPPSELPYGGGQYINLYWSTLPGPEMAEQFELLGKRLAGTGRMDPVVHMHKLWPSGSGTWMTPEFVVTKEGSVTSGEAVLASTVMTGVILVIDEVTDLSATASVRGWHSAEHVPLLLASGLFAGAAKLVSNAPGLERISAVIYYCDAEYPDRIYRRYRGLIEQAAASDPRFDEYRSATRTIFETVASPSIGHYDHYE